MGAARVDNAAEREIIEALIKELNFRMAQNLEMDISFRRQVEAPAASPEKFIVIGASHTNFKADALAANGAQVINLVQPGWLINKTRVAELAAQLKSVLAKEGEDCTIVFQMLDKNFYMTRNDEGMREAWYQSASGHPVTNTSTETWYWPLRSFSASTLLSAVPNPFLRRPAPGRRLSSFQFPGTWWRDVARTRATVLY